MGIFAIFYIFGGSVMHDCATQGFPAGYSEKENYGEIREGNRVRLLCLY